MRRLLLAVLCLGLLAAPTQALAGTPEDPEFVDICGGQTDGHTSNVEWVDICRGWITAEDGSLTFTMELESAEDAPTPMDFMASWVANGCTYSISHSEADAIPVDAVPPTVRTVADFGVACGSEPCDDNPLPNCVQPERQESVALAPADVFSRTGNLVTLSVDFDSEALAAYAEELPPGTTLTSTYIVASMGADRLNLDACVGNGCVSPLIDGNFGRDFTLPEEEPTA